MPDDDDQRTANSQSVAAMVAIALGNSGDDDFFAHAEGNRINLDGHALAVDAPRIPPFGYTKFPIANTELDRIRESIGQIESHGNYNAVGVVCGNGDRAYGKYQIMGNNIPSWTQKALGHSMTIAEFRADPTAQDRTASYMMKGYYERYGSVQDVASCWFSGRPYSDKIAGITDAAGSTVAHYVQAAQKVHDSIPLAREADGAAVPPVAPLDPKSSGGGRTIVLGDSIAKGLGAALPGQVTNLGVESSGLGPLGEHGVNWLDKSREIAENAKVGDRIVMDLGRNDVGYDTKTLTARADQLMSNLKLAEKNGASALFVLPLYAGDREAGDVKQVADIYRAAAEKNGIHYVDPNNSSVIPRAADGVHPKDYSLLADRVIQGYSVSLDPVPSSGPGRGSANLRVMTAKTTDLPAPAPGSRQKIADAQPTGGTLSAPANDPRFPSIAAFPVI